MSNPTKPMITDVFVEGARKGWNIAISSTIPNVLMAFVIIEILKITGLLDLLGQLFNPLMAIFGLPGEAATVLFSSWMSMGGGIGVAVSLFNSHVLTGTHLAILVPAIYLMGSQVQYMGRILGVVGVRGSRIPIMIGISIVNAFIAMFIMNILIQIGFIG
jgi:spore maturation protein SpmB